MTAEPLPYELARDLAIGHASTQTPMHPELYARIKAALEAPDAPTPVDWSEVVRRGLAEREER